MYQMYIYNVLFQRRYNKSSSCSDGYHGKERKPKANINIEKTAIHVGSGT